MRDKSDPGRKVNTYVAAFRRWFWLIAFCTVLAGGGTFFITTLQPPVYRATTILAFNGEPVSDPSLSSQVTSMYAELITQPVVLQKAASQVGGISAAALAKSVQAVPDNNTGLLIDVSAEATNPNRAAALANAVVSAFISTISAQGIADKYPVVVFQSALPPTAPDHPKPLQNGLIGSVFGFALAVVLVYLLTWLDEREPDGQNMPGQTRRVVSVNQAPDNQGLAGSKRHTF